MSEPSTPALSVRDLTVSYDAEPVLEGVTFEVDPGRLVGVVGPNGAGKSTMIKAIVGTLPADSGHVRVLGEQGRKALRRITYVPQRGSVDWDFPVTVHDVVRQGRYGHLGLLGRMSAEDRRAVSDAISKVGLEDLAGRQIGELSGGQQQRVFLARALAQRGDVYLMDEPFVGVDAATESAIVDVLKELRDSGRTVLVVHHDLSTASDYFDSILLLNRHLVAYGDTRDVFTREHLQRAYGGRLAIFDEGGVATLV
jgi:manganese/zinc/iron transport system ATP- binding protein